MHLYYVDERTGYPRYSFESNNWRRSIREFWKAVREAGGEIDCEAGLSHHGSDCPLGCAEGVTFYARCATLNSHDELSQSRLLELWQQVAANDADPTRGHFFHKHRCLLTLAVLTPQGLFLLLWGDYQESTPLLVKWAGPFRFDPKDPLGYGGGFWERWNVTRLYRDHPKEVANAH